MTACDASKSAGTTPRASDTPDPLTDDDKKPCKHPSEFLGAGDWEIVSGRMGDALLRCGAEKALVVYAYDQLFAITAPEK